MSNSRYLKLVEPRLATSIFMESFRNERHWRLAAVCHCLPQAVREQPVTPDTACGKQWHTV